MTAKEQLEIDGIIGRFRDQQDAAYEIFCQRLRSRGPDNITEQGVGGVVLRMQHDKMARLKKVARAALLKQGDPEFDTVAYFDDNHIRLPDVVDDLADISNYALIAILLLNEQW